MTTNTKIFFGVGAAAVLYYLYTKKMLPGQTPATAPAATAATPAAGGGTGANTSQSSAYNGILSGITSLFGKGTGASAGTLPNGAGGATPVSVTAAPPSNPASTSLDWGTNQTPDNTSTSVVDDSYDPDADYDTENATGGDF